MRIFKFLAPVLALAAVVAMFAGCGRQAPLAPQTSARISGAHAVALPAALVQHFEGNTGPESQYFLDVPPDWNGDLVLYAHGITLPPSAPVGQPGYEKLRDSLLARGFAVAASSFDMSGYALKDGYIRTHQLKGLFSSKFGPPARTYLLGRSLGGIIVQKLAETLPDEYVGGLSVSGVLCGTRAELDYVGTVRVLFDYFAPGMLPGTVCEVPPVDVFGVYLPQIMQFLQQHPEVVMKMACIMGPRLQGQGAELGASIAYTLVFQLLDDSDILNQANGCPFDNANVVYSCPLMTQAELDDLNAKVARYTAPDNAIAWAMNYYEPTGNLLIPFLTMHNPRDPQVPSWHENCYRSLVDSRGHGDNLVQDLCVDTPFAHDTYTAHEIMLRFQKLVNWVEAGVKPDNCPPLPVL